MDLTPRRPPRTGLLDSDRALRRWAVASLVANMAIIVTGALVRLTGSGLGCPTWPQCNPGSYVPVAAAGVHGIIEFANRLLTFVLVALAVGQFLSARLAVRAGRRPAAVAILALAVGLGIVAQAVIGGISVLAQLNPWVVGLHMVASVALIAVSVEIVHLAFGVAPLATAGRLRALILAVFALGIMIVLLGTVVTGAGPNSGDGAATRNGLSLEWTAKVHAWAVWAEVALTALGVWWATSVRLRRLFVGVLACELFQGVVGYVQYFTHLPIAVVLLHMAGSTLFVAALTHLLRIGAGRVS